MAYGVPECDENGRVNGSVRHDDRFKFLDAQIAMVRGRLVETREGHDKFMAGMDIWYDENVAYRQARQQLHDLLILRLGMSIGHDTTVENAMVQVENWKDGER